MAHRNAGFASVFLAAVFTAGRLGDCQELPRSGPSAEDAQASQPTEQVESSEVRLKRLQEEYLRAMRDREQALQRYFHSGRASRSDILSASRDALAAELEFVQPPEARIAILRKLVEVLRQLEQGAEARTMQPPNPGGMTLPNGNMERPERLKAEIALAREEIQLANRRDPIGDALLAGDREARSQLALAGLESDIAGTRSEVDIAEIALCEYVDGRYVLEKQAIETAIFEAEERLRTACDELQRIKAGADDESKPSLAVSNQQFAVEMAKKRKDAAETRLRVLDKYTRPRITAELEAKLKSAKARLNLLERKRQLAIKGEKGETARASRP